MSRLIRIALSNPLAALLAVLSFIAAPPSADATTLSATATTFTGAPLEVSVQADDAALAGALVITLTVTGPGQTTADLRGFYLHVADESLLSGLWITGPNVTSQKIAANAVTGSGSGNNLLGGGSPCPCDLAVELGTPGIGQDDLASVSITIVHKFQSLDVSLLSGQSFGVRATSVGTDYCRNDSSKLKGVFPTVVPEPGTALLMGLGLAGLAAIPGTRRAR